MLETRADDDVTARMLRLQSNPDYDPTVSRLPHVRPAAPEPRPDVVAEIRRAVSQACQAADWQEQARRARLAAIAIA
jgi:hypothetical protein